MLLIDPASYYSMPGRAETVERHSKSSSHRRRARLRPRPSGGSTCFRPCAPFVKSEDMTLQVREANFAITAVLCGGRVLRSG